MAQVEVPPDLDAPGDDRASAVTPRGGRESASHPPAQPRSLEEYSLQALLELSQEIHSTGDLFRVAELGLLKLMGHVGTTSAALWVLSKETGCPVLLRSLGVPERVAGSVGELCIGRIIAERPDTPAPITIEDLSRFLTPAELSLTEAARIGVIGLLFSSGQPVGAMALGRRVTGAPYSEGQLRILQASLHHLGVALENTLLYASTLEQNRELRLAREHARELDELKRQLLDNLRHELRTPLSVILSTTEILHGYPMSQEQTHDLLGVILEQAQCLQGLIVNLLTFRDACAEQLAIDLVTCDLAAFLRSYHEERRPGLAKDLREITLRLEPSLPPGRCDPVRVRQILDELVGNAVKFTPQGSRIMLHAHAGTIGESACVCIEVADNGPGIADDRLVNVFEPFRQLDGSLTREVGGIGLGLALARELAVKMGGLLELTSELGHGTIFALRLPTA